MQACSVGLAAGNEPSFPAEPDSTLVTMSREEAMASAWRLRDEGRWLETLALCEALLARNPRDDDAYRLRTLALADLGASHRAWELYRARPQIFEPAIATRLEADRVARLIVWGGLFPRSQATRLDEMQHAQAELATLVARLPASDADTTRRLRNDGLLVLNELGEHEQVTGIYRDTRERGESLPAYVGTATGDSLLAARYPELAADSLERTLAADPDAHNARILLVYAYIESERFDDAYALLESIRASEQPWLRREGAKQEYANWRRYDADVTATLVDSFAHALDDAQRRGEALVSVGAMNADLQQTLGSVYLQRGWGERGLERHRVARTLEPANPAPRVGEVQALLDLDRTAEARPLLAELKRLHPEHVHARRVRDRWQRRQGWQVTQESAWGRNTDDGGAGRSPLGTRDASHILRVASPLYDDRWRLTAHAGDAYADFQGERVHHQRAGLGVTRVQDRLLWGAEISAPFDDYDDGVSLGSWGQWRFNDVLQGTASIWRNDPDASLQARRAGITADSARVGLSYTPSELTTLDAGVQQLRYDDGNRRNAFSLAFDQRLVSRPHFLLNGFGGVYAGRGSRDDAPYFNPESDQSVELGLRADQIVWRRYERHFRHRLALSATRYAQEGFASQWYPTVRYEHEWQFAAGRQLGYGISFSRPVYDGVREERLGFDLRMSWGE